MNFPVLNTDSRRTIVIQSIELIESGGHHDQFYRTFRCDGRADIVNRLCNSLERQLSNTFQSECKSTINVSREASEFMRPSANVNRSSSVDITGGWGGDRYTFIMHVICDINTYSGFERELVVIGYTDYQGVSDRGLGNIHLDENDMHFYINSVIDLTRTASRSIKSSRSKLNLNGFNSVACENPHRSNNTMELNNYDQGTKVITPSRLAHSMGLAAKVGGDTEIAYTNVGNYSRRRGSLTRPFGFTNRDFNNPGNYVNTLFHEQAKTVLRKSLEGDSFNNADVLIDTSQNLSRPEDEALQSEFMRALSSGRFTDFNNTQSFTLSELFRIDPGLKKLEDERITVFRVSDRTYNGFRNYTLHWDGADQTSVAAKMVVDTVPSLLVANRLGSIGFEASLGTGIDGRPEWIITTATQLHDTYSMGSGDMLSAMENVRRGNNQFGGLADPVGLGLLFRDSEVTPMELRNMIERFKIMLMELVLDPISFNKEMDLYLNVICDIKGDTVIQISLNGDEIENYAVPTSMDSLMSPVITDSLDDLNGLVGDFKCIFDGIGQGIDDDGSYDSIGDQIAEDRLYF